jgi:hypothetical protein
MLVALEKDMNEDTANIVSCESCYGTGRYFSSQTGEQECSCCDGVGILNLFGDALSDGELQRLSDISSAKIITADD